MRSLLAPLVLMLGCTSPGPGTMPSAKGLPPPASMDLGTQPDNIALNTIGMSPEPFSSNVQVNTLLLFRVDVAKTVLNADVEASIAIAPRGGAPVAGAFTWQTVQVGSPIPSTKVVGMLTFTPAAPLADHTDYIVTIAPKGSFNPTWGLFPGNSAGIGGKFTAPFTTGSHPRVEWIEIISKDGITGRYVRVRFSESVELKSVLANTSLVQNGMAVAGGIADPPPTAWNMNSPIRELEYDFTQPLNLALPLVVTLGGVSTPGGQPLDPADFDSPTAVNGQFAATLNVPPLAAAKGSWSWRPVIN